MVFALSSKSIVARQLKPVAKKIVVPLKSECFFSARLPPPTTLGKDVILIADQIFSESRIRATDKASKKTSRKVSLENSEYRPDMASVRSWIKLFPRRIEVKSGERLKNLEDFPKHFKMILPLLAGIPVTHLTIVTLGGGSVGDFGGFVASVLKRGVRLVHIPTTWLAALDSAHGGKNGLNVGKIKNQVGTFYFPEQIHIVSSLLLRQPKERVEDSLGEIIKIALIMGGRLWSDIASAQINATLIWQVLPRLIQAKNQIVASDPLEKLGFRQILNFGHTIGHVIEAKLKVPHGTAVLYGVAFAMEWSLNKRILSSKNYYQIRFSELGGLIPDRLMLRKKFQEIKKIKSIILQDKKMSTQQKLRFIFLRGIGEVVVQEVSISELLAEIRRQS